MRTISRAYEFRLTDGTDPIAGAATASVTLGAKPAIDGIGSMRQGVPVGAPVGGRSDRRRGLPPDARRTWPRRRSDGAATDALATAANAPRYALAMAVKPSAADERPGARGAARQPARPVLARHGRLRRLPRRPTSASGPEPRPVGSQSALCFSCHKSGGSAIGLDVKAQYTDPSVPQNDPADPHLLPPRRARPGARPHPELEQ